MNPPCPEEDCDNEGQFSKRQHTFRWKCEWCGYVFADEEVMLDS